MTEKQTGKEYVLSELRKGLDDQFFGKDLQCQQWSFWSFLDSHIVTEYMRVNKCEYGKARAKCDPVIAQITDKWFMGISSDELYTIVKVGIQDLF